MRRLGIRPAATLVLHTWNQRLGHHSHIHVLIPAGGISLDGKRWVSLETHTNPTRQRVSSSADASTHAFQPVSSSSDESLHSATLILTPPDLAAGHAGNQLELGQRFRQLIIKGIDRLYRRGELNFPEVTDHFSSDTLLKAWLEGIAPKGYGVFVEPPPSVKAKPENILNYIGRYVTGGPISNWRILSHEKGIVKFRARSLHRTPGEKGEDDTIELSGVEFVSRWVNHILPKGFVRSRHYGNFANRKRAKYLHAARELLGIIRNENSPDHETQSVNSEFDAPLEPDSTAGEADEWRAPRCPKCGRAMKKVERQSRPSWWITMNGKYRPSWYET